MSHGVEWEEFGGGAIGDDRLGVANGHLEVVLGVDQQGRPVCGAEQVGVCER